MKEKLENINLRKLYIFVEVFLFLGIFFLGEYFLLEFLFLKCSYNNFSTWFFTIQGPVITLFVIGNAVSIQRICRASDALAEGGLDQKISLFGLYGEYREIAENLNCASKDINIAIEEQLKSERMKTELITNVSHDLKTPLTSLISYADLIRQEPCENEKIHEYAEVLERHSSRLKRLVDDLVEASKASTGNLEIHLEACHAEILLTQAVGEFQQKLQENELDLKIRQPENSITILADSRRLWRVFDNLMNNICKYAQRGTRVYLTLEETPQYAVFTFRNISRTELNYLPEELEERFVRGDLARNTEGNGLGLSIAKSLVELQNGKFELTIDGDLFKVILKLPKLERENSH